MNGDVALGHALASLRTLLIIYRKLRIVLVLLSIWMHHAAHVGGIWRAAPVPSLPFGVYISCDWDWHPWLSTFTNSNQYLRFSVIWVSNQASNLSRVLSED
ncbi:hypothetical protein C8R45DRAFT_256584 [Mycena sanguinolenta]|nr:hypothetical protein C8R45DRAFT_256584 [Mycena sanguinolenta]